MTRKPLQRVEQAITEVLARGRRPRGKRLSENVSELAQGHLVVEAPPLLLVAAARAAQDEGVSTTEWLRRAIRVRLGWVEVPRLPPPRPRRKP